MNWEPTLHSIFGEISRQLKEKANLPQEAKLKLVFYIEEYSIKVRLNGRSESISVFEIDRHLGEVTVAMKGIEVERTISNLNFKKKTPKEKQSIIYAFLEESYEKYGHFKY